MSSERFFIETWGCQMNQLDSQRMAGQLMQQSLLPTRHAEQANIILLNSCSVREKAEQKAYSRLGEYRLLKEHNPELVIGFCGCVAQQEGERSLKRIPELDFVLGTGRISELGAVVGRIRGGSREVVTGFPATPDYDPDSISRGGAFKGMVTVVEGCNKKCTFCIVPTTRGPERCRPLEDIVREVEHLIDYGYVEIELLGQTVNHWCQVGATGSRLDFADLINALAPLPGVRRLRFVTSYPRDFTPAMVNCFAKHENLSPYLHLPVQSGSNRVLQRMGRGYTVEHYRRLAADLEVARPDLALSTDIIVGFPGETEEDFELTLGLLADIRFSAVFAFKYSPRPGTAALRLPKEVDKGMASHRLQQVFSLQHEIQLQLNRELVGREVEVLVTGPSKTPGTLNARSPCHRVVHFPGSLVDEKLDSSNPEGLRLGSLTRVVIERALPHSLIARPIGREPDARSSALDLEAAVPTLPIVDQTSNDLSERQDRGPT